MLFLLFFLFSGCIYDELPPCTLTLSFSYTNSSGDNLFGETVDEINIYVFDQNDRFLKSYCDSGAVVSDSYKLKLHFEENPFTVVAVAFAADSKYQTGRVGSALTETRDFIPGLIAGETMLQDFRVKLQSEPVVADKTGALLAGHISRIMPAGVRSDHRIEMTNNMNQINLQFSGLSGLKYTPVFSSVNGRYDYENNIPSDARIRYYHPIMDKSRKSEHLFTYSTLRLLYNEPLILKLYDADGNNVLPGFESTDLMKLIRKSPEYASQIDLDKETTFNLILNFEGETIVSVSINEWEVVLAKPEM